jgi:predicted dehydrogenase
MGQGHCKIIKEKVPEMELVAVVDANESNVDKIAKTFEVTPFYSHRDLIKAGICDAVTIATPHPLHAGIAIDCLKGGLHVLSEKPLSERISTAEKMVAVAKKNKRTLAVMFQRRFEPKIEAVLEFVRSGNIGKIHRAMLVSPEYRSQAYYDSASWRATWQFEGGGVMMNQAPHVMDIFVNLVGLPVKVTGKVETKMHKIEVEDFAEATMTLKDGGHAYFYCSTNEPLPGQIIDVYGDKGKISIRDDSVSCWRYSEPITKHMKTSKEVWVPPKAEPVELKLNSQERGPHNVLGNFARHILKGEKLVCSGESGLASLELANAITLSSYLKKELKLPISRRRYDELLSELRKTSKPKKIKATEKRVTDPRIKT